jgi:hypothetical protein
MKKSIARGWKSLGTTGRIFLFCFLFYFISKTLNRL